MNAWLLLSGFSASFLAGNLFLRYREQKLAESRRSKGFDDFAGYFSGENIPRDKLRLVYDFFQSWQFLKDFPIDPDDDLYRVYGIVDEDVDDAVIELAGRWRAELPVTFAGVPPVRTVADVARRLHQLPSRRAADI